MLRTCSLLLLAVLIGCVPTTPPQQLPQNCSADATVEQLLDESWLNRGEVWRLRQLTLLEVGPKKIPLEGFLRLDTARGEARLVAMNEMGVVLFDLSVTKDGQQLERAIPQLQQVKGLAAGIARSLRQIFLQPHPLKTDALEKLDHIQRLRRGVPGGSLHFTFDCDKKLRIARFSGDSGDWRVAYDNYQWCSGCSVPQKIVMNDYRHGVKLALWIQKVKQEK